MLLEQLVNGTPPTAVNAHIRSIVESVSPGTEIRQLPSIWTIRRARTVLLTVVQALKVRENVSFVANNRFLCLI